MKYPIIIISLSVAFLSLMSCASDIRAPYTPARVRSNEVVIVGSVTFSPNISFLDKGIDSTGRTVSVINKNPEVGLICSSDLTLLDVLPYEPFGIANEDYRYGFAKAGSLFITAVPRTPIIALRGFHVFLNKTYDEYGTSLKYFGRFKFDIPEGAKALYIGEIAIRINERYEVLGYTVIDRYDSAKVEFAKRFPGFDLIRTDLIDMNNK